MLIDSLEFPLSPFPLSLRTAVHCSPPIPEGYGGELDQMGHTTMRAMATTKSPLISFRASLALLLLVSSMFSA